MATHSRESPQRDSPWRIRMDRGAWRITVHVVARSQTRLKQLSTHTHKLIPGYQHRIMEAELGRVVYYYIFLSHRHNRCKHSQEHRY